VERGRLQRLDETLREPNGEAIADPALLKRPTFICRWRAATSLSLSPSRARNSASASSVEQ
jgi:hypothetical protein